MLPWDDFRLVQAIAERGGLTLAAEHLGINHSTAFRRLAGIEAALDTRLFERHRTGYVATPAGTAMARTARRMDEDVARFGREVAGAAQEPAGDLRLTTAANFATGPLMPILARFRRRFPRIRLDVVVSEEALNLSRRDADVALRATTNPPPNLVGRRLSGLAWAIYGRADVGGDPQHALDTSDWVGLSEAVGGGLFARFLEGRVSPERVALRLNTVLGLAEAVEAGIGVGPLPCLSGDDRPALRRLSDPLPELRSTLWLLTHPELRHAPRVRAFLDFVAEAMIVDRPKLEGARPA